MTRGNARELAVHLIYGRTFTGEEPEQVVEVRLAKEYYSALAQEHEVYAERPSRAQLGYIDAVVSGVANRQDELDAEISKYAVGWDISRISRLTRCVMQLAIFETLYVDDVPAPPADCLYAISGVPTVRHGDDVMWHEYVKPQGWGDGCMYATYRNWLGVRDGEIWIISGKTTSKNYIYGMEFWKKVRSEGFDDIIALDGGGSFMHKVGTKKTLTAENRRISNKVVWD